MNSVPPSSAVSQSPKKGSRHLLSQVLSGALSLFSLAGCDRQEIESVCQTSVGYHPGEDCLTFRFNAPEGGQTYIAFHEAGIKKDLGEEIFKAIESARESVYECGVVKVVTLNNEEFFIHAQADSQNPESFRLLSSKQFHSVDVFHCQNGQPEIIVGEVHENYISAIIAAGREGEVYENNGNRKLIATSLGGLKGCNTSHYGSDNFTAYYQVRANGERLEPNFKDELEDPMDILNKWESTNCDHLVAVRSLMEQQNERGWESLLRIMDESTDLRRIILAEAPSFPNFYEFLINEFIDRLKNPPDPDTREKRDVFYSKFLAKVYATEHTRSAEIEGAIKWAFHIARCNNKERKRDLVVILLNLHAKDTPAYNHYKEVCLKIGGGQQCMTTDMNQQVQ